MVKKENRTFGSRKIHGEAINDLHGIPALSENIQQLRGVMLCCSLTDRGTTTGNENPCNCGWDK
jgi:hypothetical protein